MRHALWITRFDWEDKEALTGLVSMALKVGVTDLLMQVRGAGDAIYRSDVAPASAKIAGRLGFDPRWDPLELVCDLAGRQENARVHAWVNALSGWPASSLEACNGPEPSVEGQPNHLLLRHPDAVLVDKSGEPMPCPNPTDYVWVSPRHEGVADELVAVTEELVDRYPIAGVHLDRIRYPAEGWFDPADGSRSADGITDLVSAIGRRLPEDLELTAAIMPDYGVELGGEPAHLAQYGQDGWRWVEEGIVDSVMPMVYTTITEGEPWSWDRLIEEHLDALPEGTCWLPLYTEHDEAMLRLQARLAREREVIGVAWYSAGLIQTYDRWSVVRATVNALDD
ncbi:MAG: family 10 glycosylhydrolase [Chloroflexota bacterium]|nr:family 10 glycosylhydrolase [Chloroflexota bacterium]